MPPHTVQIAKDASELARIAADTFVQAAKAATEQKGTFFSALSGGSTPRAMHRLLGQQPYRQEVPWDGVHLFWADERCVPHTDGASNFGTAQRDFLEAVGLPNGQAHSMPIAADLHEAAAAYEEVLKEILPLDRNGLPVLDMILLGMGQDGHTASLFPQDGALREHSRWVVPVLGGTPFVNRLTMTLPVLNNAQHVVFLVSGMNKAPAVKQVFKKNNRATPLPAQQVQPLNGRVTWLLDKDAASHL